MIDMIGVYSTFSQMGHQITPTPIIKVTDSKGNVLDEYTNYSKSVLDPAITYLITDILKDNKARTPAFGSQSLLNIPGYEVAVKTRTPVIIRQLWNLRINR